VRAKFEPLSIKRPLQPSIRFLWHPTPTTHVIPFTRFPPRFNREHIGVSKFNKSDNYGALGLARRPESASFIRTSITKTTSTVILPQWDQWQISFRLGFLTILQQFSVYLSMTRFSGSLFQRDYGRHHVVSVASHLPVTRYARTGRDNQNGLGGIYGVNPLLQSDSLLLVALRFRNSSLATYSTRSTAKIFMVSGENSEAVHGCFQ
jgi:hypothetical protein